MLFKILQIYLLLVSIVQVVKAAKIAELCMPQDTCSSCLEAHISCAWCTDKQYDKRYRCLPRSMLIQYECNENNIYENEPELHVLKEQPLKDYETPEDHAVQVTPQRVYLKLVKSQPQRIKLSYRPAQNNPLDLYVLMDLTWTMRDDKATIVKLGTELTKTLRNLTANYRLGFGSYADKPTMPMIMPQMKDNPCAAAHETCEPTYGYRHQLALTTNVAAFVDSVNASRITGNLDNLEGGIDALMQVIVCPRQIGWHKDARKVVILITDGYMHFAGDGLLAGITQRNDRRCHLSEDGEYLGSLEYDYPSLEEIYRELLRRKVNVIFAVTAGVVDTYMQISELMPEISNVEILSTDSSNILELIKKSYESIIKRTQFTDNSPDYIKIVYETDCGGKFPSLLQRNYCNDVELGQVVDFYVNITLKDYPSDGVNTLKIRIEEFSLNEHMELQVELQKPCPCEEPPMPDDNYGRFLCSEKGYLQCGQCICDEGWTGTYCDCPTETTNATTTEMLNRKCRKPYNDVDPELGPICSNRGECFCGSCFCMPGWEGKYCECPACSDDCDPERADCVCGQCFCKSGWSGSRCDCRESLDGCIGPTAEICSERGKCMCGACICDDPYMGDFCEIGSLTENKLCAFYEPCVTCLIKQKQGYGVCENITDICSSAEVNERFAYVFVSEELAAEVRCLVRITNKYDIKCNSYFSYQSLGPSGNYLRIQANDCEPLNFIALAGFASLGTFLLGLLILCIIWACIRAKDRREYARFEAEQRNSIQNLNPIYRDPITRYHVPKSILVKNDDNPFNDDDF